MKSLISICLVLLIVLVSSIPALAEPQIACSAITDVPQTECEALEALYNSTNGSDWTDSTNWLETNTVGNWSGVTVENDHVSRIELTNNALSGTIPQELVNLAALQELLLNNNQLTGGIPAELGGLTNLVNLALNNNQLTGPIPPQLTNLPVLEELTLRYNQLTGELPPQLGSLTSLTSLSLSVNQLTGEIPPELGDLVGLTTLDLAVNQLTGSIPPELGNLTALTALFLYWNQLTGEIPSELGQQTEMRWFELSRNQLTGSIPSSLANMTKVYRLMLSGNKLTGSIPRELGALTALWTLSLENNQLTGIIPPELGNLTILQDLSLHSNQLTGSIPEGLGNLTTLKYLHLENNLLEGDVPATFVNLVNLLDPGQGYGDNDGLDLDYNYLNVPPDYPTGPLDTFLAQKDPDWHLYQGFIELVSPAGGEITSLDEKTKIFIPEGTLADDTTFTFLPQPAPTAGAGTLLFAENSFLLSAEDSLGVPVTVFDPPLTVTLTYNDEDIQGMIEESLALYYWDTDASAWLDAVTTCPGEYTRDLVANTLTLPLCHLSEFGLFASPRLLTFLPAVIRQ